MLAKIYSAAVYGVDAYEVEIEVNGAGGDPVIVIVGLPDAAVKESRDRVTTAISNSGYYWPRGRTTINLAPADIKKEGPSFDLPIALGMIAVTEELDSSPFENFSFVGELALDGSVRPVKGVLPYAMSKAGMGFTKPEAGVIATRPATAPEIPPSTLGLPAISHSIVIQPSTAAAVAKCVATNALVASDPAATALPALNPNQPTHSRHAPITLSTTLCGRMDSPG